MPEYSNENQKSQKMGKEESLKIGKMRKKRNFEREKWHFLVSKIAKMRKEEENDPSVLPFISIHAKSP